MFLENQDFWSKRTKFIFSMRKLLRRIKQVFVDWLIKLGFMKHTLYCLRRRKDTEEYHIFEASPTGKFKECTLDSTTSICGSMLHSEAGSIMDIHNCLTEQEVRDICALLGRKVCGVCVSHLYLTIKKK